MKAEVRLPSLSEDVAQHSSARVQHPNPVQREHLRGWRQVLSASTCLTPSPSPTPLPPSPVPRSPSTLASKPALPTAGPERLVSPTPHPHGPPPHLSPPFPAPAAPFRAGGQPAGGQPAAGETDVSMGIMEERCLAPMSAIPPMPPILPCPLYSHAPYTPMPPILPCPLWAPSLQVYPLQQGRHDLETVFTMGIMEERWLTPPMPPPSVPPPPMLSPLLYTGVLATEGRRDVETVFTMGIMEERWLLPLLWPPCPPPHPMPTMPPMPHTPCVLATARQEGRGDGVHQGHRGGQLIDMHVLSPVYSLQQGRRDVETVFTMGIMEDVNLIPHPAPGDTGMVDLTMNVVERPPGGFSAGGGLSGSSLSGGALSGLIGSFTYSHRNVRGRNQKLNVAVERGQLDSIFRASYSDPWIEGDDKRTSRAINIQNSRTPDMMVHGVRRDGSAGGPWAGGVTIARVVASVDYSRPIRPRWTATAGLNLQRAGARDDHGHPKLVDAYGSPLTFSGRASDDMLIAKLETVYTDSGDNASSQLVLSTEQAIPIAPDWLFFNRINARARNGFRIGHARLIGSFSGGTVVGDLAPHEAFPIGGTNSVRGYDEGAVGSGRSYIVTSGEISFPMFGPLEGAFFADYGTDLGSGATVLGTV
ncbi:unnamed protein product [Closterium sp. NIES-54]